MTDVADQERVVGLLVGALPHATVADRRAQPSHGYRAVHVIAKVSGLPVEIQVRTSLQHLWAELSEKLSDVVDPSLKYGGGPDEAKRMLSDAAEAVAGLEENEVELSDLRLRVERLAEARLPEQQAQELNEMKQRLSVEHAKTAVRRRELADILSDVIRSMKKRDEPTS